MKIFGYSRAEGQKENLLEMEEVTIQADPDLLRKIAHFLLSSADQIEKHGTNYGHDHFRDKFKEVEKHFPDIVVVRQ